MFTTLQLLHRLARHTRVPDIAELSLADRLELLDAANTGLAAYFHALPPARQQSPVASLVRAPVTISISIISQATGFSYVLGGGAFPTGGYTTESALIGHSVQVAGDSALNRLHDAGELLRPYLGSGGTVDAIFYADAVGMDQDAARLTSAPVWTDGTGTRRTLSPSHDRHKQWLELTHGGTPEIGSPEYYWTEPMLAHERSTSPQWLLRLWPMPNAAGAVSYTVETMPTALTLEDFTTARDLPVPDREVGTLSAMCLSELLTSRLLHPESDMTAILRAAGAAREALSSLPQSHDTRPRRMTTKRGW